MAPEILLSSKNQGYEGFPVDVWSSGISLYIMLSGTLPFNFKKNSNSSIDSSNETNSNLQYSIINKEPKYIEKISSQARDLLNGLLNKNPKKRLTIEQILNHPWLKSEEIKNNKKYHLFTKAEMIMLSKTYIDYRNGVSDDLKENFTISNLKKNIKNEDENKKKNISTKSSLLAPYNTLIQDDESCDSDIKDSFDDLNNTKINLENDIILINNKVKEYNLNYELNNNIECDNGMLINSKIGGTASSNVNNSNLNNESQLSNRSKGRNNEEEDNNILDELNENDNEEKEEEKEKKIHKILEEIEKLGYDKEYVLNCVNNNVLCHASAVFYLMLNYKNI
jgi:non-specific serine/threonine protein kinase